MISEKKILEELQKGPKTFKEIKRNLSLNSFDSSKKLDESLRKLWKEKKIFFKRSKETYHIKDSEELIGTFRETKNDYAFVETEKMDIFIPGRFVINALNGDTVKIILFPLKEDEDSNRRAGKVVRVMQRNGSAIIGRVTLTDDGTKEFTPDDLVTKHKYNVHDIDNYEENDILVTKFIDFTDGVIELKIVETIGKTNDATLDPKIISYKYDLRTSFSKEVIESLNKEIPKDDVERKDLSDRLIYTIDGEDSKDLDDAVDVTKLKNGNYKLGVHIADVSHFVKEGSLIDEEASLRSTSVYLINTVFPMLPKKLSNDLCSLNPNEKKFTFTCDMEINQKGEVINVDIYKSSIISKHRLSYNQVDELYENKTPTLINDDLTKSLILAKKLSDLLRKNKIEKGMIDFELSEVKIKLDDKGEVSEIKNKLQTLSEKVIEDLMVATNESVAKKLTSKKLPGVFRVHPKPKEENLETFSNLAKALGSFLPKSVEKIKSKDLMDFLVSQENNESADILKRFMIQSMEKAIYNVEDNGHYALGLENYLHFTSPIRRYSDLIIHRLIKKYFIDKNASANRGSCGDDVSYLESISKTISENERVAIQAERKLLDIKKSRFMRSRIGSVELGKIVSVVKFGFFIEFENLTQGLVHIDNMKDDDYYLDEVKFSIIGKKNKKSFKLGSKIKVKIVDVNIITGLIDLEVA